MKPLLVHAGPKVNIKRAGRLRSLSYLLILAPAKIRIDISVRRRNSWLALCTKCKNKKVRGRRRNRKKRYEKINKANIRGIREGEKCLGRRERNKGARNVFSTRRSYASLGFRPFFRVRFVLSFSPFRFAAPVWPLRRFYLLLVFSTLLLILL